LSKNPLNKKSNKYRIFFMPSGGYYSMSLRRILLPSGGYYCPQADTTYALKLLTFLDVKLI
jgi:hypothetical protein